MIYINLFKPNKSNNTRESNKYIKELRKIKLKDIFNKELFSIITAFGLCFVLFVGGNLFVYKFFTSKDGFTIKSLEADKNKYDNYINSLQTEKIKYDDNKKQCDIIYTIAEKPNKLSDIINEITNILPYDTVLLNVETISQSEFSSQMKENSSSSVQQNTVNNGQKDAVSNNANSNNNNTSVNTANGNNNSNNKTATNSEVGNSTLNNTNNNGTSNSNDNLKNGTNNTTSNSSSTNPNTNVISNNNSSPASNSAVDNTQKSTPENVNKNTKLDSKNAKNTTEKNNIILIEGKSLSMVNLSVYLDKLGNSKYFSRIEYKSGEEDNGYIKFTIYAFIDSKGV